MVALINRSFSSEDVRARRERTRFLFAHLTANGPFVNSGVMYKYPLSLSVPLVLATRQWTLYNGPRGGRLIERGMNDDGHGSFSLSLSSNALFCTDEVPGPFLPRNRNG